MKIARWVLAGLSTGFLAGIALSELIGVIGVIAFDREVGIKYLPFYLGAAFAIAAHTVDHRHKRDSGS